MHHQQAIDTHNLIQTQAQPPKQLIACVQNKSARLSSPDTRQKINPNYASCICITISCVTWVTGYVYSNEHNIHPVQTSMLRGFMIMLMSAATCFYKGQQLNLRRDTTVVFKRNLIFTAQAYIMSAIQFYLPLGVVHTLGTIGPISVSVYQYLLENKKQQFKQVIGIALTVVGIALTANGRMISQLIDPNYVFDTNFTNYYSDDSKTIAVASLLFVIFMILWAYAIYSTNKMKASPFVVNFMLGAQVYLLSALMFPTVLPETQGQMGQSVFYWGLLNSVLFGIAQTFFTLGIVLSTNIGMTIMLSSLTVLIAYIVSIFRYNEEINNFCLMGSVFIVLGLSRTVVQN